MGRNTQLSIEDDNGRQLAIYKVNYGSKLFYKDGELIDKGKKIAEWDPYTLPVIAETSGIANYMDLMEGSSLTETLDDATGLSSKSVTDWKSSTKNSELKPRITLRNEKGEIIKKADGNEARYYLVPDTILSVKDGQKISAGDVLARLRKKHLKQKILQVVYLELQNCLKLVDQKIVQLLLKMMVLLNLEKKLEVNKKYQSSRQMVRPLTT